MADDRSWLRPHPRHLIEEACNEFGFDLVNSWCIELATGRCSSRDQRWPSIRYLGGKPTWPDYWARFWRLRGLLHCWNANAIDVVVAALGDEHWRVREMAAKVVIRHEIGPTADTVAGLVGDPVPRVRAAAIRALGAVGEGEHAEALAEAEADPIHDVAAAAARALAKLGQRLDRPL